MSSADNIFSESGKKKELKIAYFVQTDIQHVSHIMCIYPFLNGTIYTTKKKIHDFIKKKYPFAEVVKLKNRLQIQRSIMKNRIRLVIYPSYNILFTGLSVQVFHGASDKTYIENPKILLYNLLLFPGSQSMLKVKKTGLLKRVPNWKIVGYPKFDTLKNKSMISPRLFNNKKKTILYAPTWISSDAKLRVIKFTNHGESSLPLFGFEIIKALHRDYNLIIKYHNRAYRTRNSIYDQIENLILELNASENVKTIWDDNILSYMKISDLVISDISTVCYEWFLFNKPILFANPSPDFYRPSGNMFSNTYAWQTGDVIYRPDQIKPFVEKNLKNDFYHEKRNTIFHEVFYKPDGMATERVVEEIKQLYRKFNNQPYIIFIFLLYVKRRFISLRVKWLNKYKKEFMNYTFNYR